MVEIIAKDGAWLTQSAALEDDSARIFVHKVNTPNADLWRDATAEEKAEWDAKYPQDEEPSLTD